MPTAGTALRLFRPTENSQPRSGDGMQQCESAHDVRRSATVWAANRAGANRGPADTCHSSQSHTA